MKRRMLSILLALAFLVAGVPAADVAVREDQLPLLGTLRVEAKV